MFLESRQPSGVGQSATAVQFLDLPLLPFEKQLIEAIGCSKAEYIRYRAEVFAAKYTRPAEYDHVPEVENLTTAVVVQLVIGVLLTAASMLLAPKPPEPEEEKEAIQLSSKTGRTRFGSTQNIEVSQEVAQLGQTIPILFGCYDDNDKTGGIFAPAQLVWSRMFSYGNEQIFKGLFTIGEAISEAKASLPDLEGVYLGQLAADAFNSQQIALYWSTGRPNTQVSENKKKANWKPSPSADVDYFKQSLLYGTRSKPNSADPTAGLRGDPFLCPVGDEEEAPGFSQTVSVSNNAEFGVYSPIANGTTFKLGYQIVPLPEGQKGDAKRLAKDRRRRICGTAQDSRENGQDGIGRGYTPLMGLQKLLRADGSSVTRNDCIWRDYNALLKVGEGDRLIFHIDARCPKRGGDSTDYDLAEKETDCEEIRGQSERQREYADDILHVGQMVMIGRTIWQVEGRAANGLTSSAPFMMDQRDPDDESKIIAAGVDVDITLKYVDTTGGPGNSLVSLAGNLAVRDKAICYEGEGDPYASNAGILGGYVPNFFYPLCRYKIAHYRNTRPVDVTEIGIESTVYNRAAGLCNFQSLPRPAELEKYDDKEIQVREGRLTGFFERVSVFLLQCRAVTANDNEGEWENMREQFAVIGRTDQKQFNYIRIRHLGRSQMEYRLIPKPSVDIVTLGAEAEMLQLDAANGTRVGHSFVSQKGYGSFFVLSTGRYINIGDHLDNKELQSGGYKPNDPTGSGPPIESIRLEFLPTSETKGRHQAFLREIFGPAESVNVGEIRRQWVDIDGSNKGQVYFEANCAETKSPQFIGRYGVNRLWIVRFYGNVRYADDVGANFDVTLTPSSGNIYADKWGYGYGRGQITKDVGYRMEATQFDTDTSTVYRSATGMRDFDRYSQVAELSHYDGLSKSCDSQPEHRISYVNESLGIHDDPGEEDSVWENAASYFSMQMMGLSMRSNRQLQSLSQTRVWLPDGVVVERLSTKELSLGPSNLFPDFAYWLLTNDVAGLGSLAKDGWLDKDSFIESSKFCRANKIHFDGAISDKVNIRQFLSEQAPLNLLSFSIANGKLALIPALPYSSSYKLNGDKRIPIANIFTLGNIIEGSYSASYVDVSQRAPIRAVMTWREGAKNSQPSKDSRLIRYDESWAGDGPDDPPMAFVSPVNRSPQQTFDLSQWVTNEDQALMTGRYLLALRQRITHRVNFKTTPYGLSISPGCYIKIDVPEVPTTPSAIGVVGADGRVLSDMNLEDGTYQLLAFQRGAESVKRISITIEYGQVTDQALWGTVFSSLTPDSVATTYLVEEVNIDEDGLVDITASHFPTNSKGQSLIAKDVLDSADRGRFLIRT